MPGLPFRKKRIIKWPGFFLRRRIALCSLKCMLVLAEYHVIDFRQMYRFRGKLLLTCCCCLCERLTIILVEMFSNMCYIEDNASRNCQTNTVAPSILSRSALWSLVARRRHDKKVGNFHFIYLVQVTRFYIAVEETLSVYRGARKKQFFKMYGPFFVL